MKPVLITGGAGYIGSHTVRELRKKGIPVIVLDNLTTGHREAVQEVTFYEGDIANRVLVESIVRAHQVDSVIHFAGKCMVAESLTRPDLYFHENTVKSFAFLETAVRVGVKNIVFSSTAAVYGIPDRIPVREDAQLHPINPYGASKRMIEEYIEWLGKVYGVGWISLRYFNAAGASLDGFIGEDHRAETHLIPLVLQTAQGVKEKVSVFGTDYSTDDGTCIRDYIHVLDLAQAHILALQALEQGKPSRVLNVGSGNGFSVREIIRKAESITGCHIKVEFTCRREGDPPVLVADSTALREALGWEPRYSDLETILTSAWQWHKTHPNGWNSRPD
ncbi:MAG: UDP-glucose 4-epimerase GalE [Chitinophagales bacterium]